MNTNHIIVSGNDALATTIVEELKNAGATVVKLDDTEVADTETDLVEAGIAHALAVVCAGDDDCNKPRNRPAGTESQPRPTRGGTAGQRRAARSGGRRQRARKLGLTAGMRVLDVGCGWGTFAGHAARHYGVHVVGVTLSREQADYAGKCMVNEGVSDLVEIRVQDYRDVADGPYDAISSIGMAEHVGLTMLPTYATNLYALLRPQGRLLNHAISRRPGMPAAFSKMSFIDRYVFPDGEIAPMATMIAALEGAGFEVRDVESLREHYALTLRGWVANLEANWDKAVAASSAGRARIWRLYMTGSALAFAANRLGINQVLAVKPTARGDSGMPRTRTELLASRKQEA